jgi:hypothetical protein
VPVIFSDGKYEPLAASIDSPAASTSARAAMIWLSFASNSDTKSGKLSAKDGVAKELEIISPAIMFFNFGIYTVKLLYRF